MVLNLSSQNFNKSDGVVGYDLKGLISPPPVITSPDSSKKLEKRLRLPKGFVPQAANPDEMCFSF